MYIPEFWCGVAATIIVEFFAIIIGTWMMRDELEGSNETTEEID